MAYLARQGSWVRSRVVYNHHRDIFSLEAAVKGGCDLCRVLLGNLSHSGIDFAIFYEKNHHKNQVPVRCSVSFHVWVSGRVIVEFLNLGQRS